MDISVNDDSALNGFTKSCELVGDWDSPSELCLNCTDAVSLGEVGGVEPDRRLLQFTSESVLWNASVLDHILRVQE